MKKLLRIPDDLFERLRKIDDSLGFRNMTNTIILMIEIGIRNYEAGKDEEA